MLDEDDPTFENWDQDATAVEQEYDLQEPGDVGTDLVERAAEAAAVYASVEGDQWQRPGRRSNGSQFTVQTHRRLPPARRRPPPVGREQECQAVGDAAGGHVRHTEFWARMEAALGPAYARSWAEQHAIRELDGRTVLESLEAGEQPKVVWRAVWAELDLPARDR